MKTIRVAPGIGDNLWILQKLINTGEKFIFHLPDSPPKRGKQIFDLLPQVTVKAEYKPGLPYHFLQKTNIQNVRKEWRNIRERVFALIANMHLEEGRRIEEFLPDLPTSFRIDWQTSQEDKAYAKACVTTGLPLIGIYASAYSTARAWGFWEAIGWFNLIRQLHKMDKGYKFIVIGAQWDTDMGSNLMALMDKENIPYINTIGQPLGTVLEVMKRLHYMFAFPSGLGIVAPTIDCPVTMFYPPHLEKMINAWASPADIESGLYHGTLFCSPKEAFTWAKENKKI